MTSGTIGHHAKHYSLVPVGKWTAAQSKAWERDNPDWPSVHWRMQIKLGDDGAVLKSRERSDIYTVAGKLRKRGKWSKWKK